jgi:hypothetical protein
MHARMAIYNQPNSLILQQLRALALLNTSAHRRHHKPWSKQWRCLTLLKDAAAAGARARAKAMARSTATGTREAGLGGAPGSWWCSSPWLLRFWKSEFSLCTVRLLDYMLRHTSGQIDRLVLLCCIIRHHTLFCFYLFITRCDTHFPPMQYTFFVKWKYYPVTWYYLLPYEQM